MSVSAANRIRRTYVQTLKICSRKVPVFYGPLVKKLSGGLYKSHLLFIGE